MCLKQKMGISQMTNIVTTVTDWRAIRASIQGAVGFVPTMGNLHDGHLALLQRAKDENHISVCSIFVNPTQFDQARDFERYPKTIAEDIAKLQALAIDYVFLPTPSTMYPDNYEVRIQETNISKALEGQYRCGHFDGMLTIVLKLFNIICPTRVYFGEKDYQQLLLIKKMLTSLFLPIELVACTTVRSEEQLALSSRNSRLNESQLKLAHYFAQLLRSIDSCDEIRQLLEKVGIKVDYIEENWGRRLGAIWIDDVRLIDNVAIEPIKR